MPLSPQVLESAKQLDTGAIAQVFDAHFIRVHRIAFGIVGRPDTGRVIASSVFKKSLDVIPKWDPSAEPEHWFHRYTIQLARHYAVARPAIKNDLLVTSANHPDTVYIAFITALRHLPDQQQEAFLLHFGEGFNIRDTARAMDCSTTAATTHLAAAEAQMRLVSGQQFEPLAARFAETYARLAPEASAVVLNVNKLVRRHVWPRRILRWLTRLFLLALLLALAYAGWWIYHHVEF
jgi:DNA-directed RNA polymerase specialized sigma24 family protein